MLTKTNIQYSGHGLGPKSERKVISKSNHRVYARRTISHQRIKTVKRNTKSVGALVLEDNNSDDGAKKETEVRVYSACSNLESSDGLVGAGDRRKRWQRKLGESKNLFVTVVGSSARESMCSNQSLHKMHLAKQRSSRRRPVRRLVGEEIVLSDRQRSGSIALSQSQRTGSYEGKTSRTNGARESETSEGARSSVGGAATPAAAPPRAVSQPPESLQTVSQNHADQDDEEHSFGKRFSRPMRRRTTGFFDEEVFKSNDKSPDTLQLPTETDVVFGSSSNTSYAMPMMPEETSAASSQPKPLEKRMSEFGFETTYSQIEGGRGGTQAMIKRARTYLHPFGARAINQIEERSRRRNGSHL